MSNPELTSGDILRNARALLPAIARRADDIEANRRLPEDLVRQLKTAGVFRIMYPREWAGPEMPLPRQLELIELLATADASVAWCVKIGSDLGYLVTLMEEAPARELITDIDHVAAGQAPPNGRAVRVDGGYRVSGRWGFGSGCTHADIMMAGCLVVDGDDASPAQGHGSQMPDYIMVMAPADKWHIEDTWYSTGLAGSGSHHYSTEDLFVPEGHTIRFADKPRFDKPLYRFEPAPTLFIPMTGAPLGLARRAVDTVLEYAGEAVLAVPPPPTPMKDVARVRSTLARAETKLGSARAYCYDALNQMWEELETRGRCEHDTRRDVGLSRINAFRMAVEVTTMMVDLVGARAIYRSSPLERYMRDAITMNQHLGFDDLVIEQLGGMMFGKAPTVNYI